MKKATNWEVLLGRKRLNTPLGERRPFVCFEFVRGHRDVSRPLTVDGRRDDGVAPRKCVDEWREYPRARSGAASCFWPRAGGDDRK